MKEHKHQHLDEGLDHTQIQHNHKPYWKQIHHTWYFWVFLFLMLASILYYVMSVDFALAPHRQLKPSSENSRIQ